MKIRKWSLVVAMFLSAVGVLTAQVPSSRSSLAGKVNSAGKPLEGVAVSARADGKTYTTTVFTDSTGAYSFPASEDGRYSIWAQAVGLDLAKSDQVIASGKTVQQNFTLQASRDFSKQLAGDELLASLPGDSPQDNRLKSIFINNCTGCHQANFLLQNRFDARGWGTMVNIMSKTASSGIINPDVPPAEMIQAYKEELVGYLTQVRGPNSAPLNFKLAPRPAGEAAQAVITEFDVPPPNTPDAFFRHNGSNWAEGEPSGHLARAPHDAVVDQQGIVWFTDQTFPTRTIGKLDPKTGATTPYMLAGKDGTSVHSHGLALDREGNVWLSNAEEGTFSKFDTKTEQFIRFPRPESLPRVGGTIVVDSKGGVWAETAEGAIKLDPKSGKYTAYTQPTPGSTYGIAIDREDKAWITQPGLNRLVVVDTDGKVSEVNVPAQRGEVANDKDRQIASTLKSGANAGTPLLKAPRRLAADPNGDYMWVAEYTVDQLARIDIHTKEVKEYPLPHRFTQPYGTVVDKNHMVWIALMNTDRIAKFDPSTERFTEYTLPTRGTEARFITVDNNTDPPTVWVPYYRTNKLARIRFRSGANTTVASAGK